MVIMWNFQDELKTTGQRAEVSLEHLYKSLVKINKSNNFHNKTLLDAGCGNGKTVKELTELTNFKKIDGVEVNKFAVDYLTNNPKENPYENIYNSHILDFQPKEKYDFCILVEVLEHLYVKDVIPVLQKLLSICDNLIITTPHPSTCFQLKFNVEEIQNTINNLDKLNNDEFVSLEGAIHKSTVTPFSMWQAGFKVSKWDHPPPNYVHKKWRTMFYVSKKGNIKLNKIRTYGVEDRNNFKDLKQNYLNLLIESTLFFPMFNYEPTLIKRISYYLKKLKTYLF